MKIGITKAPDSPRGTYSQHLANLLESQAPEHKYIVDDKYHNDVDLYHYHGFRQGIPWTAGLRGAKSVVTVPNLNFLRYPHLYTLAERVFLLRAYRYALRAARRVITVNSPAREELSARLSIPRERIEVVMPLAALAPSGEPHQASLEAVRRKYGLPEQFILMLGTVEPRHNHQAVFEALADPALPEIGVVVCGRRTGWSDDLLRFARERHIVKRVDFLYELTPDDLPALFRLARVFAYLPGAEAEASIVPVVEALRARVPMLLSDTPLNREAAGEAALYVRPEAGGEVVAALRNLVHDADLRRLMHDRERRRAELFSEYAVAKRLIDIYSSL